MAQFIQGQMGDDAKFVNLSRIDYISIEIDEHERDVFYIGTVLAHIGDDTIVIFEDDHSNEDELYAMLRGFVSSTFGIIEYTQYND